MTTGTDSALTRARSLAAGVRRAVLRRRRLLAVVFTVAAVAAGARAVLPPAPATVDVVVAARDLPAGDVLGREDLTVVALPPDTVPAGVLDDPTGATLSGAVGRGEPLTRSRVMGSGLTTAQPGTTAVPVRLSDPAQVALLRVGMRIDLLATDPKAAATEPVATDVTVLGVPPADGAGTADALSGRVVVLGVPHGAVADVTAATVSAYVTFAWSAV